MFIFASYILLIISLNSVNQVAPKVRKTLQLFRLRQINNGVFVKLNKVNKFTFSIWYFFLYMMTFTFLKYNETKSILFTLEI